MMWFNQKRKQFIKEYLRAQRKKSEEDCFVVFDTEFSGLEKGSRLLSLGYVVVRSGSIVLKESGEFFLKQEESAINEASAYHEITKISEDALEAEAFFKKVLAVFSNRILVAHNAFLDVQVINRELAPLGTKLKNKVLDTHKLAVFEAYGKSPSHIDKDKFTLDALADQFGLRNTHRHRALSDAYITAQVFLHYKK